MAPALQQVRRRVLTACSPARAMLLPRSLVATRPLRLLRVHRAYLTRADAFYPPAFMALCVTLFWARLLPFWLALFLIPVAYVVGMHMIVMKGAPASHISLPGVPPTAGLGVLPGARCLAAPLPPYTGALLVLRAQALAAWRRAVA